MWEFLNEFEKYEEEIIVDFHTFYSKSPFAIGTELTLREGVYLFRGLKTKPESLYNAASSGWDSPMHPLYPMLADLIDVNVAANSEKKIEPYYRPYAAALKRAKNAQQGINQKVFNNAASFKAALSKLSSPAQKEKPTNGS